MSVEVDVVVVGGGPGGQKAAICAAKAGQRVVLVDREREAGGACVRQGTIPSKTLRETALALRGLERKTGGVLSYELRDDATVAGLTNRLGEVIAAHDRYIGEQLGRNGIDVWRGHARFVGPRTLEVIRPDGERRRVSARVVVLATGSRPRTPPEVAVDHEHVLDSDSILSMTYLPRSLVVLGAGVVASEYASIFATLGVRVTMIDRGARPMPFLDEELTGAFVAAFAATGSRFVPGRRAARAAHDGVAGCVVELDDGTVHRADKVLCALGRVPYLERMGLDLAGVRLTERGYVAVDAFGQTSAPGIYAVGDVTGPPALASTAMEQGRRAMLHALGKPTSSAVDAAVPFCAYTIPEIASVGLSASEAAARYDGVVVGRAPYREIARAHVAAYGEGMIKLVAGADGRILGAQIVGEGASELIHVCQMALVGGLSVDTFVDAVFNFPTLGEGYRIAALDILRQRRSLRPHALPRAS